MFLSRVFIAWVITFKRKMILKWNTLECFTLYLVSILLSTTFVTFQMPNYDLLFLWFDKKNWCLEILLCIKWMDWGVVTFGFMSVLDNSIRVWNCWRIKWLQFMINKAYTISITLVVLKLVWVSWSKRWGICFISSRPQGSRNWILVFLCNHVALSSPSQ